MGLIAFLACGTLFAMENASNRNESKTELYERQDGGDCVFKADRVNEYTGKDEIQITNNCSDDIVVEFDYWSGSKWIHSKYRVGAKTKSVWFPAESYKNYTWDWA